MPALISYRPGPRIFSVSVGPIAGGSRDPPYGDVFSFARRTMSSLRFVRLFAACLWTIALAGAARAVDYAWSGTTTPANNQFNTSTAWTPNGTPTVGDAVFFRYIPSGATTTSTVLMNTAGATTGTVNLAALTTAYTLGASGNGFALDNGTADATWNITGTGQTAATLMSANLTFSTAGNSKNFLVANNGRFGFNAISFAGTTTTAGAGGLVVSGPGTTTFSGGILVGVTGGVAQNGPGTLVLSSTANAFSGGVAVNGGVLEVSADTNLGDVANAIAFNGGALRFTGTTTSARALTFTGAGTIDGTSSLTTTGQVSGAGALTKVNTNVLTLQNNNSYTGAATIGTPGAVVVGANVVPLSGTTGGLTLSAGGRLATAASLTVNNNQLLAITRGTDVSTAADRLGTVPLAFNGGRFTYSPGAGAADSTATLGTVSLSGLNVFRHGGTSGAATGTELKFGNLTRTNNAVVHFGALVGTGLGQIGGAPSADAINFTFANVADPGGTGTGRNVIPWASGLSGTGGSFGVGLLTYDAGTGFRRLTASEATLYTANANISSAQNGQNLDLQATVTLTENVAANSIQQGATAGTPGVSGAFTLAVTTGAVNIYNPFTVTNTTIAFAGATGYFHQGDAITFSGTGNITGTAGVVFASVSTYRATFNAANTFTGGLYFQGLATSATSNSSGANFDNDNQLGAAGQPIFLNGGSLLLKTGTGDVAFGASRTIALNGSGIIASATGRVLNFAGTLAGPGQFIVGTAGGSVAFTNAAANTYTGGTYFGTGATLLYNRGDHLGSGTVFLNGGTLQAGTAGLTLPNAAFVGSSSTIAVGALGTTLSGAIAGNDSTLTKTGTGTLSLTGVSPFAGTLALGTSTAITDVSGANGRLTGITTVTAGTGSTFRLNNAANANADRLNDSATVSLAGGTFSYLAPSSATTDPAERIGVLTSTASGSRFDIDASAATSPTVIRFAGLGSITGGLLFSGTGLGNATGNYSRILFDTAPTLSGGVGSPIQGATFANASGGASQGPATYDPVLGIKLASPALVSGTTLDNYNPTATPLFSVFTTSGNASAKTGVQIFALVLDGGSTLTLDTTSGTTPTNANNGTVAGTLFVSNGQITSQTSAKTISQGTATPAVVNLGASAGIITTTTDLTIGTGVALTGSGGLTKLGAGTLAINGTYGITGPLAVSAGTIAASSALSVGDLSGTGTISLAGNPLTITESGASTFAGSITGATTVTKAGTGTLTLAPSSAFSPTGGTVIAAGTLVIGNAAAATGVLANFTLGTGTTSGTLDLNGNSATSNGFTILGTGTGHQIINSNAGTTSTVTLNLPADATAPVAIGGNIVVNKTDANLLVLTGTAAPIASPTGVINVNAGTFSITSATPVGLGMSFGVSSTGTLDFGSFGNNVGAAFGTITSAGSVKVTGGSGDLFQKNLNLTGGSLNFTGTTNFWWHFTGAGAGIAVTGGATPVTFTGPTTGSRIQNDNAAALPINVTRGTAGVDLDANINFTNATGAFAKTGNGIMQITYTGGTGLFLVNGGVLQVASPGSLAGATAANNGGTLKGTGTVAALAINDGGTVQGGNGDTVGVLTSAATTFNGNAKLRVVVGGASASSLTSTATLNPGSGTSILSVKLFNDGSLLADGTTVYTYQIAAFTSTTGVLGTNFTIDPNPENFAFAGTPSLTFTGLGTGLQISFVAAVPEPTTVLGVVAALGALGGYVRRRRAA